MELIQLKLMKTAAVCFVPFFIEYCKMQNVVNSAKKSKSSAQIETNESEKTWKFLSGSKFNQNAAAYLSFFNCFLKLVIMTKLIFFL